MAVVIVGCVCMCTHLVVSGGDLVVDLTTLSFPLRPPSTVCLT